MLKPESKRKESNPENPDGSYLFWGWEDLGSLSAYTILAHCHSCKMAYPASYFLEKDRKDGFRSECFSVGCYEDIFNTKLLGELRRVFASGGEVSLIDFSVKKGIWKGPTKHPPNNKHPAKKTVWCPSCDVYPANTQQDITPYCSEECREEATPEVKAWVASRKKP
jgi:endogenous inhibitor of DNA gyrase (YacG/DUF329 family)